MIKGQPGQLCNLRSRQCALSLVTWEQTQVLISLFSSCYAGRALKRTTPFCRNRYSGQNGLKCMGLLMTLLETSIQLESSLPISWASRGGLTPVEDQHQGFIAQPFKMHRDSGGIPCSGFEVINTSVSRDWETQSLRCHGFTVLLRRSSAFLQNALAAVNRKTQQLESKKRTQRHKALDYMSAPVDELLDK